MAKKLSPKMQEMLNQMALYGPMSTPIYGGDRITFEALEKRGLVELIVPATATTWRRYEATPAGRAAATVQSAPEAEPVAEASTEHKLIVAIYGEEEAARKLSQPAEFDWDAFYSQPEPVANLSADGDALTSNDNPATAGIFAAKADALSDNDYTPSESDERDAMSERYEALARHETPDWALPYDADPIKPADLAALATVSYADNATETAEMPRNAYADSAVAFYVLNGDGEIFASFSDPHVCAGWLSDHRNTRYHGHVTVTTTPDIEDSGTDVLHWRIVYEDFAPWLNHTANADADDAVSNLAFDGADTLVSELPPDDPYASESEVLAHLWERYDRYGRCFLSVWVTADGLWINGATLEAFVARGWMTKRAGGAACYGDVFYSLDAAKAPRAVAANGV